MQTVTSQVSGLPPRRGMRVQPSGRSFSVLVRQTSWLLLYRNAGCAEGAADTLVCGVMPHHSAGSMFTHETMRALASNELPHRQEWWLPSSEPSLSATAMRTASSSSRSPQAVIVNAKSQSLLCVARAARKLRVGTASCASPLRRRNQPKDLVCPMTTAWTPTDLREAGHIKPPNGMSTTPPTRPAAAEDHQESLPVTEE